VTGIHREVPELSAAMQEDKMGPIAEAWRRRQGIFERPAGLPAVAVSAGRRGR